MFRKVVGCRVGVGAARWCIIPFSLGSSNDEIELSSQIASAVLRFFCSGHDCLQTYIAAGVAWHEQSHLTRRDFIELRKDLFEKREIILRPICDQLIERHLSHLSPSALGQTGVGYHRCER